MNRGFESLEERVVDGSCRLTVWGSGYIGLSSALAFAHSGLEVRVVDPDTALVEALNSGHVPFIGFDNWVQIPLPAALESGAIGFGVEPTERELTADVHLVCVSTDRERDPDPSNLMAVAAGLGKLEVSTPRLVVIESTVAASWLHPFAEAASAHDRAPDLTAFGVAPRRDWFLDERQTIANLTRVVGSSTPEALPVVLALYRRVSEDVVVASSWHQACLVKALENSLRFVGIVLANQLREAYPESDIGELFQLAATKFNVPMYQPSIGIGGYCVPLGPRYVMEPAREVPLLSHAVEWDLNHPTRVATAIIETYAPRSVAILGFSYAPDIRIHRLSPAHALATALQEREVRAAIHDPHYSPSELACLVGCDVIDYPDGLADVDLVVIAAAHKEYRSLADHLARLPSPPAVLDNFGSLASHFGDMSVDYATVGSMGQARARRQRAKET